MRKWLAGVLILLGLAGLALGWAGQTVWAPKGNHTARASFENPGAAVVINPGVLYVGGKKGTVTITSSGDYYMISAPEGTVKSYLENSKYTAITGASNWATLATSTENADKKEGTAGIQNSDLWTDIKPKKTGESFTIEDWSKAELDPKKPQPYRAILLANDGDASTITKVEITWPTNATNAWTPYAYAAGAVLLIIGLVLLLIALTSRSRPTHDHVLEEMMSERQARQQEESGESDAGSAEVDATVNEDAATARTDAQSDNTSRESGSGESDEATEVPEGKGSHRAQAAVGTASVSETEPSTATEPVGDAEPAEQAEPALGVPQETADARPAHDDVDTPVTVARKGRRRGTPDDVTDRLKALELENHETGGSGVSTRHGRRRAADGSDATTTMTDPIATRIEEER